MKGDRIQHLGGKFLVVPSSTDFSIKTIHWAAPTLVVHFHKQAQIAVTNLWVMLGRCHHCGGGGIHGCAS
jgi:hypothetical protein